MKNSRVDIPNHRSSHDTPTPSAGGVVFVVVIQLLVLFLWRQGHLSTTIGLAIAFSGGLISFVGFLDDRHHLSKRWRLWAQVISVLIALALLPKPELQLSFNWGSILANEISFYVVTTVATLWLINLFNFMDGIDGLAVTEAIMVLCGASFLLWINNESYIVPFCLVFPLIGFGIINFPPAKIFMGDTGSTFLGFTLAALAIALNNTTTLNLWCWGILLNTFITDSTCTLIVRIFTRQPWHEAHRSHCYQIIARRYNSQKLVTISNSVIIILWLTPLAAAAQRNPNFGFSIFAVSILPLAYIAFKYKCGIAQNDTSDARET